MVKEIETITADDLIIEYMIGKLENGYEPEFTVLEFIDFLSFFEKQMKVEEVLEDKEQLLSRFFERETKKSWYQVDKLTKDKLETPHLDYQGNLVKANYRFRTFDTHFLNHSEAQKIREIIISYLKKLPKRSIAIKSILAEDDLMTGNLITAGMMLYLWKDYIDVLIGQKKWPPQCSDIYKYLLDYDLSEHIGLPSIKEQLLDFYHTVSARIATLYEQDRKLQLSTYRDCLLARSNYLCIIDSYQELVGESFDIEQGGYPNRSLVFDFRDHTMVESLDLPGFYVYETNISHSRTTKDSIDNPKVKALVQRLNQEK